MKVENGSTRFAPEIVSIDEKLHALSKKLNISAMLKPQNYDAELSKFLEYPQQYNPVFEYNFPDEEKISDIKARIAEIENDISKLSQTNFAKIFTEKLREMQDRMSLVLACKNSDYEEIYQANERLFGAFNPQLLDISTKKVLENARTDHDAKEKLLGHKLSHEEIIAETEKYFAKNNITPVPIEISTTTMSRMAAAYKGDSAHVNLRSDAVIFAKELPAILAHEIGIHLRRYQNGLKNELKIFRS